MSISHIAIFVSVVLITTGTLLPFNFTFDGTGVSWSVLSLSSGTETYLEIVSNGLLYLPLGFGLSVHFRSQGMGKFSQLTYTAVICFALSYFVEVLQSFLPSRHPTWRDVGANTSGGILGYLWMMVGETKSPSLSLFVYLTAAGLLSIPLQLSTSLNNWQTSFPLIVGNEHTGDRPWKGSISEFYIARKAATEDEVRRTVDHKSPVPLLGEYLVAYYKKDGTKGYRDEIGQSPRLESRKRSDIATGEGSNWFETEAAPGNLTKQLITSSQFTLGATISSDSGSQSGPARIISLSADAVRRNFTLGQQGEDLIVRLRTPLTGPNGVNPSLRVPSVFSTPEGRHIVITYNGTNLHVYIDGLKSPESLKLTPALFVYNSVRGVAFPSSQLAQLFYYGIIFLPAGVMLLLATAKASPVCNLCVLFPLGGAISFLLSLLLEGILILVSGRQGQLENILLGMFFCYFSFLGLYFLRVKTVSFRRSVQLNFS
jgi:hypothetical protein